MNSTSTIIEWIQAARAQHAYKLLLRGKTPPLIESIEGTKVLAEDHVNASVILSFAIQLIKQSGQDTDIGRITSIYLKAHSKKMGHLRAQIFRQRGEITVAVGLCDNVLPSREERNISDEILEDLMQPGLHLISGYYARMQLFGLVASAAQTAQNHPIIVAKGRPYEIPTAASHIEMPFDIPDAESAVAILPDIMSTHVALDLPLSCLNSQIIHTIARHQPVWQHVERSNHTFAMNAVSIAAPQIKDVLNGGLDDDNYHSMRST